MSTVVEVRCPAQTRRLFSKLIQDSDAPPVMTEGNLLEVACPDCKRELRGQGDQVLHVLHRFDFVGDLVETEVVRPPDRSEE